MGCGCNKSKVAAGTKLSWSVDLTGTDRTFPDGAVRKTYATISEANVALAGLSLIGTVRPKPATS